MAGLTPLRLALFVAFVSVPQLVPKSTAEDKPDPSEIADLVHKATMNYEARESLQNNYTYLAHAVRVDSPPGTRTQRVSETYEIMFIEGQPYRRLTLFNEQPLSPEQEKREQALFDAEAKARQAGLPAQKSVHTSFAIPIAQLLEDFDLRWQGKHHIDRREVDMVEAVPLDANQASGPDHEYARHFRIKLWIDPAESQIVRLQATVIRKTIIDQQQFELSPAQEFVGSRPVHVTIPAETVYSVQWTEIGIKTNDEAWLPEWAHWKTGKTVVEVVPGSKPVAVFPYELTWTYSDYKKFRVDTRVLPR